jgi:hypothetical protein
MKKLITVFFDVVFCTILVAVTVFIFNTITDGAFGRKCGVNAPYLSVVEETRTTGIGITKDGLKRLTESEVQVKLKGSFDR